MSIQKWKLMYCLQIKYIKNPAQSTKDLKLMKLKKSSDEKRAGRENSIYNAIGHLNKLIILSMIFAIITPFFRPIYILF